MSNGVATYPLISVIVPVYNVAAYLERCLRCLREQTYSNLEFILINDGSTDESGKICDQIAVIDERFKVFHIANGGASLARKFGLEQATGEYVSFVDSDDCIANNYIELLYELICKYNTDMVACYVQRIFSEKDITTSSQGDTRVLTFDELMRRFFKYEFWGFPAKLYRKAIFKSLNFPKSTLSEDYYVMAQLFTNGCTLAYSSAPLYYYEYHEGSLSHLKLSKRAFEEFDNVKAVYELTQAKVSQYAAMALSNVVETCIKLLSMVHRDSSQEFSVLATPLSQFLKSHLWEIMRSNKIYWKLKIMVIKVLI
ncbi:MAG: glycosyltransferase family 2 protein [Rikenellaceae bacterium]|nr:glycosyltransferase family 2 protein [Rikenellaceae bacterium]MBQ5719425.1 glycosyltransferase family 2 protein [Alistipes sp.]